MNAPSGPIVCFAGFELDTRSGQLRKHGRRVKLPEQSFQVLTLLLTHAGEIVTRDDLRKRLWPEATAGDFDGGLNNAIKKLRAALGDSADTPRFIETLPRRGYRFLGSVTARGIALAPPSAVVPRGTETESRAAIVPPARRRVTPWVAAGLLVAALSAGAAYMVRLQQQIASDVATAAGQSRPQAITGGGARRVQEINPPAYDAFTKGLTAKGLQRPDGFHRAVAYFEEAIGLQPDFGEAYAELALVQVQFLFGGPKSPHEVVPKAEAAARKALLIDDRLGQAHWAMGQILNLYYWRWEEGDRTLRRAAGLPGGRDAPVINSLVRQGRFAEALAAAERARSLDSRSVNAQVAVGTAYRSAGQRDRAIEELRRALVMSPGLTRIRFQLGVTFAAMGRLDDAIVEFEAAGRPPTGHNARFEAYLGYAYAASGRSQDARELLTELESHRRDQYVSSFGIALIHDALGENELALAALQRAFDDRAVEFAMRDQYPPFRRIVSDPRFRTVMSRVGSATER